MKKSFTFYAVIWLILLAAFNAVVFLVRPVIPGFVIVYDARFWVAWGFIIAAFIGNLVCAYLVFKEENLKKKFYNLSLLTVSCSALIAMLVAGSVLMLIPGLPAWIAAIACILIFAFNAVAVIKAVWSVSIVKSVGEKVNVQTAFIKIITGDAEGLVARAKSDAVKAECKKVYEAVRYSDPMSGEALYEIEEKITVKMDELSSAVGADDAEKVKEIASELTALVGDRNNRCKFLK